VTRSLALSSAPSATLSHALIPLPPPLQGLRSTPGPTAARLNLHRPRYPPPLYHNKIVSSLPEHPLEAAESLATGVWKQSLDVRRRFIYPRRLLQDR